MDTILIMMDRTPFAEGVCTLIELKLGNKFHVKFKENTRRNNIKTFTNIKILIVDYIPAESIKQWREINTKVVLISSEPEDIMNYLPQGIFNGLLLKNMPTNQLLSVVEEILYHDEHYVHPKIGSFLLTKLTE